MKFILMLVGLALIAYGALSNYGVDWFSGEFFINLFIACCGGFILGQAAVD